MIDLYQILGIHRQADAKEIKMAFKKLAVQYHPDKNPDDLQAEERFKQINTAYQVLSDQAKKFEYDKLLRQATSSSAGTAQPNGQAGSGRARHRKTGSQSYYRPKKQESSKPLMTPWEIAFWLGGGIFLMFLFIWGLSSILGHYESKMKFQKASEAYYRDNNPKGAINLLADAINRNDEFGEAYWLYGKIVHEVGRKPQRAVFLMDRAFQFSDFISADMYFVRAEALSQSGEYDRAIADLQVGLQIAPTSLDAKEQLAELILYKKYQFAESVVLFDQILAVDSTYQPALLHQGVAFYKLKQYSQSNQQLIKALSYEPKEGVAFLYMGLNEIEYYLDTANACNQWRYAEELGVRDAKYYLRKMCE